MEEKTIIKWRTGGNRPKVLFDMDDVVTNFLGHLIEAWNKKVGPDKQIREDEIKSWDLSQYADKSIYDIFRSQGFFEELRAKEYSISTIKKLIESKKYDIYIVTACGSPEELAEKMHWFSRYIPEFNTDRIISIKEKDMIRGDILCDDNIANLDACARYMDCVIYDMPSNQGVTRYPRIKTLRDILPILEEKFY